MKLINLTEHVINIPGWGDPILPSGQVTRVKMERTLVATLVADEGTGTVGLYRSVPGAVTGLPREAENVGLIVSTMVRVALPGRMDLFSPGELIRDPAGRVDGARSLDGNT